MNRLRSRVDNTHWERIAEFQASGCTVVDLHAAGLAGVPDLIVGCMGVNHLVEIKSRDTGYGRLGLSDSQSAFALHWNGGPVHVVWTTEDVVEVVARWRAELCRKRP